MGILHVVSDQPFIPSYWDFLGTRFDCDNNYESWQNKSTYVLIHRWCLLVPKFLNIILSNPCPLKKIKPSYCNTMLATCIIAGLLFLVIAGIPQCTFKPFKGLKLQAGSCLCTQRRVTGNAV